MTFAKMPDYGRSPRTMRERMEAAAQPSNPPAHAGAVQDSLPDPDWRDPLPIASLEAIAQAILPTVKYNAVDVRRTVWRIGRKVGEPRLKELAGSFLHGCTSLNMGVSHALSQSGF